MLDLSRSAARCSSTAVRNPRSAIATARIAAARVLQSFASHLFKPFRYEASNWCEVPISRASALSEIV
jgi:hypothetical protein